MLFTTICQKKSGISTLKYLEVAGALMLMFNVLLVLFFLQRYRVSPRRVASRRLGLQTPKEIAVMLR